MALSGSVTTNTKTEYDITTSFKFDWTATQNTTLNQSTVSWTLTTVQSPTGTGYKRGVRAVSISLDGSEVEFKE